jgi:hypothetical protein
MDHHDLQSPSPIRSNPEHFFKRQQTEPPKLGFARRRTSSIPSAGAFLTREISQGSISDLRDIFEVKAPAFSIGRPS